MLTDEEVERYLNLIFTGQKLIYINNELFIFKQPDNNIKMKSDLIYDAAYNKAIKSGILSTNELEQIMDERGIISETERKELDGLNSQLKAQKILLAKTTKVRANQERILANIKRLESEISEIESKTNSMYSMAAESKAAEEKALYLCWACTYTEDNKLCWAMFDDLLKETNIALRNEVLVAFLKFKAGIETDKIRYIAKHSLWRIRYVTSQKVSDELFGVPTSQYTNDMLNLAYWSNFYQNVYEMMPKDRPPDSVIEDDEALDAYMKAFYEERNREDAAERDRSGYATRSKLSAFDKDEVIVTRQHELYEDIDYTKPREAQGIKDRTDIKKKIRRGKR